MKEVTLQVDGMRCEMCESHVCDQLRKVEGVRKAKASHRKGIAKVTAEDSVDVESLSKAVEAQGYRVNGTTSAPYVKKGLFARLFGK